MSSQLKPPQGVFVKTQRQLNYERATGAALKGHIDNAHRGEVDPNCNACKELQQIMEDCNADTKRMLDYR
jgi:hypothetical protein